MQPSPCLTRSQAASAPNLPGSSLLTFEKESVKKKRIKNAKSTPNVPELNSLPVVKPANDMVIDLVGSGPTLPDFKVAEPRKMLYISNLDPCTTKERVSELIYSKFGINPLLCSKLVSIDRNLETLEYVSFKVLVPENGFDKFLDSTSWPSGVIVREFIPRKKNLKQTAARI